MFFTRLFAAILLVLLSFVHVEASRVSPMIVELEPIGRSSVARVNLFNDGTQTIPYEVQMMKGTITPDGQLELAPADAEFVVFPPQALIESNSQQVFRIQYVGEQAMEQSQVYYMAIRQIPVEFEEGVSQIQMVVNFNVLVNVVPDDTEAVAVVNSAEAMTRTIPGRPDSDDPTADAPMIEQYGIQVDVGNVGNRYFLAGFSEWRLTGTTINGEPFDRVYRGDDASREIGVGVVAPNLNRIFFFPTEVQLQPGSVQVELTL